jgi:hypothetical protein
VQFGDVTKTKSCGNVTDTSRLREVEDFKFEKVEFEKFREILGYASGQRIESVTWQPNVTDATSSDDVPDENIHVVNP